MNDKTMAALLAVFLAVWVICVLAFPVTTLALTAVALATMLWAVLKAFSQVFRR